MTDALVNQQSSLRMITTIGLLLLAAIGSTTANPTDPIFYSRSEVTAPLNDEIDYRLPTNLVPIDYTVSLVPDLEPEGNFTFDGEVQILIRVEEETDNITLHTSMLIVDEDSISVRYAVGIGQTKLPVDGISEDIARHFYIIHMNDTLIKGRTFILTMSFKGKLHDDMQGFYRSSYMAEDGQRWLATTQFQAVHARRAFPCFDEPAMRATFTISISRPQNMRAISNMPQDGDPIPDVSGRFWDRFQKTKVMPTYLVAFIVSDFAHLEDVEEKLRIFAQPPMIQQAQYGLSVSPPLLNWLANYTEIDYMLPKMDEAAIPDFDAGAMENWGLATYRERLMLFEEGVSTSDTKQRIATVIAHEYAHQWFGDLVTPEWWSFAWLNEGFATYFEFFATANVETSWRLEEQFVVSEVQGAMAVDALETSHPMTFEVCSPTSINAIFDSIIYAKAGSVIRMMKHMVSPETFRMGLKSYLTARSYVTGTPDYLYAHLHERLILDNPTGEGVFHLPTVMKTWSDQMGYPVITVKRNYDRFTADVTQERFLLKKTVNNTDPHVYKWHIPLTYTTQQNPDFSSTKTRNWFKPEQSKVSLNHIDAMNNQWIIFNIQETGYYRVNYDPQNWALLTKHMDSDDFTEIHLLNRAQLIDDAFNLARAGYISYTIPLSLSRYLKREVDYVPWWSSFNAFSFLTRTLSNDESFVHLQSYFTVLMTTLYEEVGFDEGDTDGHVLKLNRAAAVNWACSLGYENCTTQAVEAFKTWMSNSTYNPIKPDLKSAVYCTALREGDTPEWQFLWSQYISATVSSEQTLIISALGCTKNTTILDEYLRTSITEDSLIRRQDSRSVFTSVYNNREGVDIALDFLIDNFQNMSSFYGGLNSLGSMLSGIANRLNTEEQATKLKDFLEKNAEDLASAGSAVENAVNIVDETLEWQRANAEIIIDWVKEELGVVDSTTKTTPRTSTTISSTPTSPGPITSTIKPTTSTVPTTTPGSAGLASLSSMLFALVTCVCIVL